MDLLSQTPSSPADEHMQYPKTLFLRAGLVTKHRRMALQESKFLFIFKTLLVENKYLLILYLVQ